MAASNDHIDIETPTTGCGILGRYPILSVVAFASCGVALGVGLSVWDPDDDNAKTVTLQWVGLVGDMFIRSLKAIVLPLVFVNVLISVVDMMSLGRASSVGWKTIGLYTMTTLIASVIGLIAIVIFKNKFEAKVFVEDDPAFVKLGCNADGQYLTEIDDGTVMCMDESSGIGSTDFLIDDVSGTFQRVRQGARDDISLSDTIYDGVFTKLITSNIFESFVESNFAAVIIFAIFAGVALGGVVFQRGITIRDCQLVMVLTDMSDMFLALINMVIGATPFAVFSLIANAVGSQDDLAGAFSNVGWLIFASLMGFLAHLLITDITLLYFLGKVNPFEYLSYIVPAQTTALACASSAATLPVTLRCVKATGLVPDDIRNFVCPLGATVNMDGSAIYFPCACVWLAYLNGINPNASRFILLVILSTVGSVGTAPVPSSALVLIITAYNTVFGGSGTPNGFEFIVAIDWFLDRCITALNVTGDTVVSCIIAQNCPLTELPGAPGKEDPKNMSDESAEDPNEEISNA